MTRVEFSRPIVVGELPEDDSEFAIEATGDERRALAVRLGVVGIDSLRAEGTIKQCNGKREICIEGFITADMQQVCVVSLDVLSTRIESRLDRRYSAGVPNDWMIAHEDRGECFLDSMLDDWIEPITDGIIDIGEAVTEELCLNIAPYPRKPGEPNAQYDRAESDLQENIRQSPFASLSELPLLRKKRQH